MVRFALFTLAIIVIFGSVGSESVNAITKTISVKDSSGASILCANVCLVGKNKCAIRNGTVYELSDVDTGTVTILVSAPEYRDSLFTLRFLSQQDTSNVQLSRRYRPSTIGGVVWNQDKSPIQGVSITVTGTELQTTTNENGDYRVSGIPRGEVQLHFHKPGYVDSTVHAKIIDSLQAIEPIVLKESRKPQSNLSFSASAGAGFIGVNVVSVDVLPEDDTHVRLRADDGYTWRPALSLGIVMWTQLKSKTNRDYDRTDFGGYIRENSFGFGLGGHLVFWPDREDTKISPALGFHLGTSRFQLYTLLVFLASDKVELPGGGEEAVLLKEQAEDPNQYIFREDKTKPYFYIGIVLNGKHFAGF